ncbi:MAG: nitrous oxide reductase family maturation protein NosD [Gammaproteobacteria bacterium]|jgi:nitrous oxidase accessory protein|nr:nitrous oxide reductase family maturation protein NosD [Gammaproteobacteria bacterium]MBT3724171.1 nitrous oxide reductase family maturation protein NosD [Gammaproteobacteria bacterium]MBT4078250.1 nitrous oxide reductase family maturation protein NosD [Gammaproteobacteria bacterium]MBT4194760.1 nitrous oxide reductase family maturation protein NosD [Gammaproteobacteria bacterium]MBT4450405.1 nitrous oxide reductase family maturation protein NosD [Gammaproteobacteria bacterium]
MLKYIALYFVFLIPLSAVAVEYPLLQDLVDAAEPNSILIPPPGTYSGPVTLDYPLTIDGKNKVTIDAGGTGSVIFLDTDGAIIRNLHLTNTGESHNDIDAGVQVRGNFNVIKDNVIDNSLFGIDLQQSDSNIIRRNTISSKDVDLGVRGDSVRLWYSFNNKIEDNVIRNSRDMVVWYSADNTIARNDSRGGRYSLHFMYSRYNDVDSNHYENNSVGIFLMYSDGVKVRNNYIAYANGPTGMGIGFKETSDVDISNNKILYCATGMYIDVSPYDPETTNRIHDNVIAFTNIGIDFLNDWTGNIFERNSFKGNQTQISVAGGKTANRNVWKDNYWDDYEGFDLDKDGIGDTPYELYGYADRIWMDVPAARFLQGTPVMAVLDFLERLAPFSAPDMLVRDKRPLMEAKVKVSELTDE